MEARRLVGKKKEKEEKRNGRSGYRLVQRLYF